MIEMQRMQRQLAAARAAWERYMESPATRPAPARGAVYDGDRYLGEVLDVDMGLMPDQASIRVAAHYLRQRYGMRLTSGLFHGSNHLHYHGGASATPINHQEDDNDMQDRTTLDAPSNPYRTAMAAGLAGSGAYYLASEAPGGRGQPPRHDTEQGPGLLAGDLDRIAREHFARGHATAKRAGDAEVQAVTDKLAGAYDEGYTAGRVERAQGLAHDVFLRLAPAGYHLDNLVELLGELPANGSLKAEARERIVKLVEQAQAAVAEGGEFATHVGGSETTAAAQVARDEE